MVRRLIALPLAALVISTLILGGISLAFSSRNDEPQAAKTVTTLDQVEGTDTPDNAATNRGQVRAAERSNRNNGKGNGNGNGKDNGNGNRPTTTTTVGADLVTTTTQQPTTATTKPPTTATTKPPTTATTKPPTTATTKPPTTATTKPPTTATTKPPITTTTKPPTTTTTAPPPGDYDVHLYPGDNVAGIISSKPTGTSFLLHKGVYKRVTISARGGQVIAGEPGTILDGQGSAKFGITGGNDVTVRNLTVTNYTEACVNWGVNGAGFRWTIENVEASYCSIGVRLKNDSVLRNSYVHHNGTIGVNVRSAKNVKVIGNEIAHNNPDNSWNQAERGALFARTTNLVVRNNYVHHNKGNGIHTDDSNSNALIENNRVIANTRVGIFHEIGFSATIRNNHVEGNGFGTDGRYGGGAGILVFSSRDTNVYGNTIKNNRNGLLGKHDERGTSAVTGETFRLTNLHMHDNVVTMNEGLSGQYDYASGKPSYQSSWNNRYVNNRYNLRPAGGAFFRWVDPNPATKIYEHLTLAGWQSYHPNDG